MISIFSYLKIVWYDFLSTQVGTKATRIKIQHAKNSHPQSHYCFFASVPTECRTWYENCRWLSPRKNAFETFQLIGKPNLYSKESNRLLCNMHIILQWTHRNPDHNSFWDSNILLFKNAHILFLIILLFLKWKVELRH